MGPKSNLDKIIRIYTEEIWEIGECPWGMRRTIFRTPVESFGINEVRCGEGGKPGTGKGDCRGDSKSVGA